MNEQLLENLYTLGLSRLEAEIYILITEESKLTGYRISKMLGKPVSNIYKSLATLESKGVIISEGGQKNKIYSALPITDYLDKKERELKEKGSEVVDQLERLNKPKIDDGLYQLSNIDQVYARANEMIRSAKYSIIVDAYPTPLNVIKDLLEETAERGVDITVEVVEDVEILGCKVIIQGGNDLEYWPCDWFNIVVDGEEFILSFLKREERGVYHALWSKSPYISFLMFYSYAQEIITKEIMRLLDEDMDSREIKEIYNRMYSRFMSGIPGNDKIKNIMLRIGGNGK